jgi:hypothetical protein
MTTSPLPPPQSVLQTLSNAFITLFFSLAKMGAFAAISTGSLLYFFQTELIYQSKFPAGSRDAVAKPSEYQLPYEDVNIKTPDNIMLRGYLIKQHSDAETKERPTLLFFQVCKELLHLCHFC